MVIKNRLLHIFMNGIEVGILEKSKQGYLQFSYTKSWQMTEGARPISLSLPMTSKSYTGDLVFNFFDNLLPDNPQIRKRIQAKFSVPSNHPFDLLSCIGNDCVGAIQFVTDENHIFDKSIKYKNLTEQKIANILRSYQSNPLGMNDDYKEFRISLAGVQEKAAFLYYKNKWNIPLAVTPTTHIFKLPIGTTSHQQLNLSDSCENEWLCSEITKAFGLPVANCSIEFFEDVKVLVVDRFDRQLSTDNSWIMRLPLEDMCQALGFSANLKYQSDGGPGIINIMQLLLNSHNSVLDCNMFFKSQILFWLLCAIDGHAKNFSVFIEQDGRYNLTPLYDIMSAFPLIANKQLEAKKVKMAMALKGKNSHYKWCEARRSHFIDTARNIGYSTKIVEQLLNEMLDQVETVIDTVTNKLPPTFPESIVTSVFAGMRSMKKQLL